MTILKLICLFTILSQHFGLNYHLKKLQPKCINSLEKDIQQFPYKELDWNVYTSNIKFKDPLGIEQKGLFHYKNIFSLIRFFRIIAVNNFEIKYILKYIPESDKIIILWYSNWFIRGQAKPVKFNAISCFYLNENHLIYKHQLDYMFSNENIIIIQKFADFLSKQSK